MKQLTIPRLEPYRLNDGQLINAHPESECSGNCAIHAPSEHSMVGFGLYWRTDRGLMERICPHGVGHPDPDDLAYKKKLLGPMYDRYAFGTHGCDGCCFGAYAVEEEA